MIIRQLRQKDIITASKIVGLNYSKKDEALSKKEIEAMFEKYTYAPKYIVAEENKKIVGFAGYIMSWMDYHVYNIFWVNVAPEHQGKGIGTKLIKRAILEIQKNKSYKTANMIIITTNKPQFYEKIGFKILSELRESQPKEYLMSMKLG
jgi:N-acetylglutamate synthase-like GNAT family acetyltransferase